MAQVTRRGFVGGAALATAGALMGAPALVGPVKRAEAQEGQASASSADETVYSWCRQCVLPPCGIQVDVKDGIAVSMCGNAQSPTNKGKLCARGNATLLSVYNPYRVKKPLKRTNPEKGIDIDPGWVEVSWDEALEEIAEKLKEVRNDDPRKFVWINGFARSGSMIEGMDFCEAFGTPNYVEVDGPTCSLHFGVSLLQGNFTGPLYDPLYTKYLILMGKGEYASDAYAPSVASFSNAVARGMKVVSVDPRCSIESSKGEWVPIKPGTDFAFVLAMQYVMVHEIGRLDTEFLKTRTNAPYLIGPDGHYVRDESSNKPLIWDEASGEAKVFDAENIEDAALEGSFNVGGTECSPGFSLYKEALLDYTPEWAEEVSTVSAATIRRISREFVDNACIGQTIEIDGVTYPYRPVSLEVGRGSDTQYYGGVFHCSTIILHMLVGALDCPGGGSGSLGPAHKCTPVARALSPDDDGIVLPKIETAPSRDTIEWPSNRLDGRAFFPYSHDCPHLVFDAILNPEKYHLDYTPTVMQVWAGNPIMRVYSPDKICEALSKMEFIYTVSYSLDEPTMFADIVLPETSGLERYAVSTKPAKQSNDDGSVNHVVATMVAQRVIDPVYDARQAGDIFIDLADRLGILYGEEGLNAKTGDNTLSPVSYADPFKPELDKRYDVKGLTSLGLKSLAGQDYDLDDLRNTSEVPKRVLPLKAAYPYTSYPQGKTRYALYMENLVTKGENLVRQLKEVGVEELPGGFTFDELMEKYYVAIPRWIERRTSHPEDYNLLAINWKTAQHSFGNAGSVENPWLLKTADLNPYLHKVCINPSMATKFGLSDGDTVCIESCDSGESVQGELLVTQTIHEDCVGIAGLFGHTSAFMNPTGVGGMHFNKLMATGPEDIDPLGAGFDGMHYVKVTKA